VFPGIAQAFDGVAANITGVLCALFAALPLYARFSSVANQNIGHEG